MRDDLTRERVRLARIIAASADLLQIGLFPLFLAGGLSMANNVIDLLVALALVRLLGWHWAFAPTFVAELVPVVELVPTWTAAVFLATRGQVMPEAGDVVVDVTPQPAPPPALPRDPQSPRGSSGA